MGWINLEAVKKLTTEITKNIYLQFKTALKSSNISNIWLWTAIKRGLKFGQKQMTQIWRAKHRQLLESFIADE